MAPRGNQNAKGNKGGTGRPTVYSPKYIRIAEKMCELGATDLEIADALSIGIRTLYEWKARYPEFSAALKPGKAMADDRVERSLYARAVGYDYDSEEIKVVQGAVVRIKIREHVPPDPAAGLKWLQNRRPETWRERQQIETTNHYTLEQIVRYSYEEQERRKQAASLLIEGDCG